MASVPPKMRYPRLSCPYRNCSTCRGMSAFLSPGRRLIVKRYGKSKQQLEIPLQRRRGEGVVHLFAQHQAGPARTGKTAEEAAEKRDSLRQGPQASEPRQLME